MDHASLVGKTEEKIKIKNQEYSLTSTTSGKNRGGDNAWKATPLMYVEDWPPRVSVSYSGQLWFSHF